VSPGAAGASRRRTPRALRELLGRQRGRLGEPRGSPGTCGIPEYGVLGWISAVPGEGRNLPCLTHGRLKLLNHQSIKERGRLEVGGWEEGLLSSPLLFGIKRFISVRNLNLHINPLVHILMNTFLVNMENWVLSLKNISIHMTSYDCMLE